jgi:tetratricopeptide (TPR) repeat protein
VLGILAVGVPARPAHARQRRLPVPLRDLEAGARPDSLDPQARVALGRVYWERGKHAQAEDEFLAALALDPRHAEATLAAGIHPFARESRYLVDLRGRLGLDSARVFLVRRMGWVWDAIAYDPLVDLTILRPARDRLTAWWWGAPLRKAFDRLLEGRNEEAFALLDEAIRAPDRGSVESLGNDFLFYFALAALRTGHPERAADAFKALSERIEERERTGVELVLPNARPYYEYLRGDALARAGDPEAAVAALERLFELDLGHFLAHARLADIAEAEGDHERALGHRRAAVGLKEDDARLRLDLAATLLAAGDAAGAAREARRALDLDARSPRGWYLYGRSAEAAGEAGAAREAYARFVAIAPSRLAAQRDSARLRMAAAP